jgi:ATP/maltotriose-dependent transcriptional regulator MalT
MHAALSTAFTGSASSSTRAHDLASWASAHLRGLTATVVIDNLDVALQDLEVSVFLAAVIDRTKGHLRWVLASRGTKGLPVASWMAYHDADIGLDVEDLRFTLDEARASAKAISAPFDEDDLAAIFELTNGWPAAFTFALRTASKARGVQSLTQGTREMVYQFLAEQVWNSLDADARGFLRIATFLPWIDRDFVAEAGHLHPSDLIETLRSRVGLISIRDFGTYELHDLFRAFVERTLLDEGTGRVREAQISAARILEQLGFAAAAIDRYADAGACEDVGRLLDEHNVALLDSGHYAVAQRALKKLSESSALELGGVIALRAALEEAYGHVAQAEALYSRALLLSPTNARLSSVIACRYALLLFQQGRTDAIPMLEELLARSDLSGADRTEVAGSLAVLVAYGGQQERALGLMRDAITRAEASDDVLRARTYGRASTVAFFVGDEQSLEWYALEAARIAESHSLYGLAARVNTSLSAQHAAAGRVALASTFAANVVLNAEKAGDLQVRARGLRELMSLEAELGHEDRLIDAERELSTMGYRGPNGLFALLVAKSMMLIWNSKFREAAALLSKVHEHDLAWYQHRLRTSLLALAAAANADRETAVRALAAYDWAVEKDKEAHSAFERPRALGVRYAILASLIVGKRSDAKRLSLDATRAGNSVRFDAFDAAIAAVKSRSARKLELALEALRSESQSGIAKLISAATASSLDLEVMESVTLTATELAVLRSLARGLTNQAIAESHGRTVNTIRTHVAAILRKLNCETRGEAVATARRSGIV